MTQEEKMEYGITEDYVSFEVAKLLKEKGFDECIFEFYESNKIKYARNGKGFRLSELGSGIYYPHITHQMAMKWLREVHCIHINIFRYPAAFLYNNKQYKPWYFQYTLLKPVKEIDIDNNIMNDELEFDLYEEAVEAAIKYCLENLI